MDINIDILNSKSLSKFVEIDVGVLGTGCLIDYKGQTVVLTNEHVVQNQWLALVTLNDSSGDYLFGEIIYADHIHDLALISVDFEGTNATIFTVANTLPEFGDPVITLGYRSAYPAYNIGYGVVTCPQSLSLHSEAKLYGIHDISVDPDVPLIETTAAQYHGFSGGPLVDKMGQLLGINTISRWKYTHHYSSASTHIDKFIEKAIQFGNNELQRRDREHQVLRLGLCLKWSSRQKGCTVIDKLIETNENSNINVFDTIVEINGKPIESLNHFIDELDNCVDNTDINVKISGDLQTFAIKTKPLDLVIV
ncbi:serine endoprotease DegS-like [Oppia nitens]|uniref:serine endoprotease DegS-like n=1 Tax=Oppia nitens TaxID=1686743 RepID=UPI0023DA6121|nr:serine endoprotease DegS-like [Oppia nitens]